MTDSIANKFIVIHVIDDSGCDLGNVVVDLYLDPKKKNPYAIGVKITNELGRVSFSQKEIEDQIELTMKTSPMDYSGFLTDCKEATISALTADDIERHIEASDLWGVGVTEWRLSSQQKNLLRGSKNHLYAPSKIHVPMSEAWAHELVLTLHANVQL